MIETPKDGHKCDPLCPACQRRLKGRGALALLLNISALMGMQHPDHPYVCALCGEQFHNCRCRIDKKDTADA